MQLSIRKLREGIFLLCFNFLVKNYARFRELWIFLQYVRTGSMMQIALQSVDNVKKMKSVTKLMVIV